MSDGLILTTGSNGILGLAIARALAANPVPFTAAFSLRSISKGTALELILSRSSQKYMLLPLDVSTIVSVRNFASSLVARITSGELPRIRSLICAAAIMQVKGKQMTEDGMETNFQINYLANFLLVLFLMPVMRKDCRIMFFTSNLISDAGSAQGPRIPGFEEFQEKLPDLVTEKSKGNFDEGTMRYGMSKKLLSMFAAELQRRLDASSGFGGVSVVTLDPGTFVSGMINEYPPVVRFLASYAVPALSYLPSPIKRRAKTNFTSSTQAAEEVLKLALDKDQEFIDAGGKMFAWGLEEVPLPADMQNEKYRRDLWKRSMTLSGIGDDEVEVPLNM